eukprot:1342462-Rhodomonas_salina.1
MFGVVPSDVIEDDMFEDGVIHCHWNHEYHSFPVSIYKVCERSSRILPYYHALYGRPFPGTRRQYPKIPGLIAFIRPRGPFQDCDTFQSIFGFHRSCPFSLKQTVSVNRHMVAVGQRDWIYFD